MLKNFILFVGDFILTFSVLVLANHCVLNPNLERQLELTEKDFTIKEADLTTKSNENNTISTINETVFWALPDAKNTTELMVNDTDVQDVQATEDRRPGDESFTTEEIVEQSTNSTPAITEPSISADDAISEETNYEAFPQVSYGDSSQANEKIILSRKNCHAEIAVHENTDTKLTIKFEQLQNNSYGRCYLTLRGHKNSMLGVLISNVHLYRNNTQGEVLKVIIGEHHSAFVLKEYYGLEDYEPLLLTESHKVYLVLYYKVDIVAPNLDWTYFCLEVFTYHKTENNIHHYEEHKNNYNHLHG